MHSGALFAWLIAGLIVLRWAVQLWLERLNLRHVQARGRAVPVALKDIMDGDTYAKSVDYTRARGRFSQVADSFDAVVLLLVLFTGILPWVFRHFTAALGTSVWAMAGFVFLVGMVLAAAGLPLSWHQQFRLEQQFGFNTTTPRTWRLDRLKTVLLSAALGYPLLVLVLWLVEWAGDTWWLWAWSVLLTFQLVMSVLAPVLILPLFNKFTPLPEGSLRDRLLSLAKRTHFRAAGLQVMDGSRRSRHSNAFFTGVGRFRKIVLFDTLIAQLAERELEAVLAHEVGHYKLRHIVKLLGGSALGSLAGFYLLSVLARQHWFYHAFGFEPGPLAPALLVFGLLAGVVTFWLSPVLHAWSRRYEYQADAFATRTLGEAAPLVEALRKLTEKNLSNLTPHPLYSAVHYSHPTLLEREQALANGVK